MVNTTNILCLCRCVRERLEDEYYKNLLVSFNIRVHILCEIKSKNQQKLYFCFKSIF